jgi:hypothetical protein
MNSSTKNSIVNATTEGAQNRLRSRVATPSWMWLLYVLSAIALILSGVWVTRFLQGEFEAQRILAGYQREVDTTVLGQLSEEDTITQFMQKRTSSKDTQAWIELNAELRSSYFKRQIRNLMTLPDTDKPVGSEFQNPERPVHEGGATEGVGQDVVKPTQVAWKLYPELVRKFVLENEALLRRAEQLCEDDTLVYLPVVDRGRKSMFGYFNENCRGLLFLGLVQAIADRNEELVSKRLRAMDHLSHKFDYLGLGNAAIAQELIAGLHLALDAGILSQEERDYWDGRVSESDSGELYEKAARQSRRVMDLERLLMQVPGNMLPSLLLGVLNESDRRNLGNARVDTFRVYRERLRESIQTRLAILKFIERTKRLPMDLAEVSEVGIPVAAELKVIQYERTDEKHATLTSNFGSLYEDEYQIPKFVSFEIP